MNCKNCKYWKRKQIYKIDYEARACDNKWYKHTSYAYSKIYYEENAKIGYHRNVVIEELPCKYGSCDNSLINYSDNDAQTVINNSGLDIIYCDNECYGASHVTGENFGCIGFEEK